jgi:hypothetical protein
MCLVKGEAPVPYDRAKRNYLLYRDYQRGRAALPMPRWVLALSRWGSSPRRVRCESSNLEPSPTFS